ncbi:MAG: hypothetical protein KDC87_03920 [Planctomycetes bacterium]|nr:hypothetical protein [Planctomycetota bacterium]MCB9869104.1 hypothetical protein [Planctomycetota bacterium]MCB9889277.1 hypothetical protein [Planctomycetota bacterium]
MTHTALPFLLAFLSALVAPAAAQKPGQKPKRPRPHAAMEFGPCLAATWKARWPTDNISLKGLSLRVGGEGGAHVVFDTELLRVAAMATDFRRDLTGTAYDGKHGPSPALGGNQIVGTPVAPGWACAGSFTDPRPIPHGPLPRHWGRYSGLYLHGDRTVLSYRVGSCAVLETFDLEGTAADGKARVLARTLEVGKSDRELVLRVAVRKGGEATVLQRGIAVLKYTVDDMPVIVTPVSTRATAVALIGGGASLDVGAEGEIRVKFPAHDRSRAVKLLFCDLSLDALDGFRALVAKARPAARLETWTHGGPAQWGEAVATKGVVGKPREHDAYVVDSLRVPRHDDAHSYLRFAAFDFFSDGRAALSTWNGDVWVLSGIDDTLADLRWKRFATGLFDPLGLKIVNDVVHTLGRDQITKLHDLNGDGEADFYECFNNDVLITKNFHEFAFDLQTDPQGNFYFSKAGPVRPGGRGFDKIVPHHGCVLKVDKDGRKLEVYATGLRAPNGIGVGPQGQVTSGDNEGTWTPVCRLNWMKQGTFNGCVDTAHRDPKPTAYDPPLCFLPMSVDNSGGGQAWVTTGKWGPFQGEMLHLSYGTSSLFKVVREEVDGVTQGGVVRFPLKFTSSCMRGRFHPKTGQLFVVGLKGWQTNAARLTGFDRVRYTGEPVRMLTGWKTAPDGVFLTFTCPLDKARAEDPQNYEVEVWDYVWAQTYGSPEISPRHPDRTAKPYTKKHDPWKVAAAKLQADGKTVFLSLPEIQPVMQIQVKFDLADSAGVRIKSQVHASIHRLPKGK